MTRPWREATQSGWGRYDIVPQEERASSRPQRMSYQRSTVLKDAPQSLVRSVLKPPPVPPHLQLAQPVLNLQAESGHAPLVTDVVGIRVGLSSRGQPPIAVRVRPPTDVGFVVHRLTEILIALELQNAHRFRRPRRHHPRNLHRCVSKALGGGGRGSPG